MKNISCVPCILYSSIIFLNIFMHILNYYWLYLIISRALNTGMNKITSEEIENRHNIENIKKEPVDTKKTQKSE